MAQASKKISESSEVSPNDYSKWMFWKKRRYVVAIFAFLGFFNVYALRANLSIAIVAMTEKKNITVNGTTITEQEFAWDSQTQGLVLSSFFYGYITTQLFGGWISSRIGGKKVFGIGVGVTAALTLLTPVLAKANVYLLLTVRIIEGIFEGVTYPCIHAVWARWAPPLERSKLATIAFSGSYVGTVVSMPVSAYLAEGLGWPSIFYFFGCIALVWCLVWWIFVAESPADDPRISKQELEYIRKSLGNVDSKNNVKHPWKQILTSLPVWAIVVIHFCDNWGFYTLLTQLPTLMKDLYHMDLGKTGFMSGLPYIAMAVMMQSCGQLADWLLKNKIWSTTLVRKFCVCFGFIAHIIFMVAALFWLEPGGTITCLTLAVGIGVMAWSGFGVNYLDIAPQHASVIMGVSNTFATLAGIFSPIVVGNVVTSGDVEQWRIVFYIASAIFLLGAIVYGLLASGELQTWAVNAVTEISEDKIESEINAKERISYYDNQAYKVEVN